MSQQLAVTLGVIGSASGGDTGVIGSAAGGDTGLMGQQRSVRDPQGNSLVKCL